MGLGCWSRPVNQRAESQLASRYPEGNSSHERPAHGEGAERTMARSVSYVSAAKLVSMARGNNRLAIIDVRDDERSKQAHIPGSHHYASTGFAARMPELARTTADGKDTLVFHCALSQICSSVAVIQWQEPNASDPVRGPSCARMFSDYLSENKDTGIKNVMVLERGYNGWEALGYPVCRCTDAPCKGTCS
ncbi:hypothetical protein EJB05_23508 [Eragrostis curvula]|uniref:Rhodanese domain-containing protein n=1 Tax=Eragrostis curvula TaxID=38414 RepID=A0A5J9V8P0_9POAL|nr:hypothetical protein EJB05_23508 [Eragrostis curvula]